MKTLLLAIVLGAILIGSAGAMVFAWGNIATEISLFGWTMIAVGALVSILLGGGLMALSFFSARRGFDERVDTFESGADPD